eukprot:TRINITY_DN20715_c0_g1_i1.p1 TRINITY_DN20715_c0_g1~~TRINITY_DN20715_c0_g1_i1.p1  ORF type:complete len:273 (-),score=23.27 TRINITY_DN20715_c0_g1_i1:117-935(-)
MFARPPIKGQEVYGVLSDPTYNGDGAAFDEGSLMGTGQLIDRRSHIRRRTLFLMVVLAAFGCTAIMLYRDQDPSCDYLTHSALPFSLITQATGRYRCLMMLTVLSVAAALSYPISVARKPRPYFLHVAGMYLVLNAIMLCSDVTTIWAGCYNGVAYVRIATAYLSIASFFGSFCLMQYSILLKAEALNVDATEDEKKLGVLRKSFRAIFNPYSIGFAVLSTVVPLGFLERGPTWTWSIVVLTQAAFIALFCLFLFAFTVLAITRHRQKTALR